MTPKCSSRRCCPAGRKGFSCSAAGLGGNVFIALYTHTSLSMAALQVIRGAHALAGLRQVAFTLTPPVPEAYNSKDLSKAPGGGFLFHPAQAKLVNVHAEASRSMCMVQPIPPVKVLRHPSMQAAHGIVLPSPGHLDRGPPHEPQVVVEAENIPASCHHDDHLLPEGSHQLGRGRV